jgi:hypothetical protein
MAGNEMYPNGFCRIIASHGMYGGETILYSFPFRIFNPSVTIDRATFSVKNSVCMEKVVIRREKNASVSNEKRVVSYL